MNNNSLAVRGISLPPIRKEFLEPIEVKATVVHPKLVRNSGVRVYGAAKTDRLTADWTVSVSSANSEIQTSATAVRSRLRQLERDDDYMRRMLRLFQNNVIGHQGIMLEMKIREQIGTGKGGKPIYQFDIAAGRMIEEAWGRALRRENCTVSRNLSGLQVQRLAVRSFKRDGGALFRIYRGFNNSFGFALRPIEIDRLDVNWNGTAPTTGNDIRFSMELDQFGAVVAYWILSSHPGDVFPATQRGNRQVYRERVPADEIIAIWDIERAEQLIGMPDMCSVAKRLNALGKYEEAEGVAARVAACKGGFIQKNYPEGYSGPTDDDGQVLEEMSPGMITELGIGETFVANDPKHPMDAYPSYVKSQLRGSSAGANLSYNAVANDLESVNYSSLKAGRLEDIEEFETLQGMFIEQLMTRWAEEWLPFAIISGQVKLPIAKLEKFKSGINWQPRTWKSVEPLKEVQADLLEIEGGLDSRRNKIGERGRDLEQVDEEQQQDLQSEKDHGVDYSKEKIKVEAMKQDSEIKPD